MHARPIFARSGDAATARRRVMLVSYHFPPDPTIGARRWERLAPFLIAQGWGLDVITCAPPPDADMRRLQALPAGVRVFGVPPVELPIERVERVAWQLYRAIRTRLAWAPAATAGAERRPSGSSPARSEWVDRSTIRWQLATPRGMLRAYWTWLQDAQYGAWADGAVGVARAV